MSEQPSNYQRIYAAVALIPRGKVATYGQIANLAGLPRSARFVGYALSALTDKTIPWHRVVNARGEISPRSGGSDADDLQRLRLEREGVVFDGNGRIDLRRYRWRPDPAVASLHVTKRPVLLRVLHPLALVQHPLPFKAPRPLTASPVIASLLCRGWSLTLASLVVALQLTPCPRPRERACRPRGRKRFC